MEDSCVLIGESETGSYKQDQGSPCLTDEGREALFKKSEVFKMAESALKDLSVNSDVRLLEKLGEKWLHDQVTRLKDAMRTGLQKGRQEGHAEGMQKGRQEGMQTGLQKGRQEGMQAVALAMLKKSADMSFISEVTGLSEEEINKLKNGS